LAAKIDCCVNSLAKRYYNKRSRRTEIEYMGFRKKKKDENVIENEHRTSNAERRTQNVEIDCDRLLDCKRFFYIFCNAIY
jgi:hypothetical protein